MFLVKIEIFFFPKLSESLHLISFSTIAVQYLSNLGYKPYLCDSEAEARNLMATLPQKGYWPCLFRKSDTTGEKDFEEFYTDKEQIDLQRFDNIGVIKNKAEHNENSLIEFERAISQLKKNQYWTKEDILNIFKKLLPNFNHSEKRKHLDSKM